MAGQAVEPFLKDGIPDGAIIFSHSSGAAEVADAVLGIAPSDLIILRVMIGRGTVADGTCVSFLKECPSGVAPSATSGTGYQKITVDADNEAGGNSTAELALAVDGNGVPNTNVVKSGSAIVLDTSSTSTALTDLHCTVIALPQNGRKV